MRKRTLARECALKILYRMEMAHEPSEEAGMSFWKSDEPIEFDDELKQFATQMVRGVEEHGSQIDVSIAKYADNWQLDRMAVLDRNILRMGSYELKFCSDIPPKVAINEAVDLAKKYSGQEAGKFVNAILDKIRIEQGR